MKEIQTLIDKYSSSNVILGIDIIDEKDVENRELIAKLIVWGEIKERDRWKGWQHVFTTDTPNLIETIEKFYKDIASKADNGEEDIPGKD